MESVQDFLNNAEVVQNQLEDLYGERRNLDREISSFEQQLEDNVVMALYEIQNSLDEEEEVVLMSSTEHGRGGFYSFNEVLTSSGVVAEVEEDSYSSDVLYTWPGNFDDFEEPLDIESEYLVADRDSPGFVRKISSRLRDLEGEPPESSFYYD